MAVYVQLIALDQVKQRHHSGSPLFRWILRQNGLDFGCEFFSQHISSFYEG
jgi:hypothetical protein